MRLMLALSAFFAISIIFLTSTAVSEKYENCALTFYNSGDRNSEESREKEICNTYGITTEYLPLPKVNSSSGLLLKLRK